MKVKNIHIAVGFLFIAGIVYAGNQYNWGTSTGGAWSTPDDTVTTVGQPLQIGASGGAVAIAGGAPLSIWPRTLAQIQVLTPGTTGQIAFCSNCTNTPLVISTGVASGSWAGVFLSSGSTGLNVPK